MADFTKTASAKTALQATSAEILTREAFPLALARGLDKVWKRETKFPTQGEKYFRLETTKREDAVYQTYRGMGGMVPQNRDADEIPYGQAGDGFGFTVNTYTYRKGVAIEKTLEETDDVGVARGKQADLVMASKLTLEYAMADVFNRGLGAAGAPFVCDDGMYLVDSARPSADPAAGTWSNLESTGAITETSLFTAMLNARAMTGEDGELYPTYIKKIIIPPAQEKTLWTLLKTDLKVASSLNDKNFMQGKFEYEVYDWLTSNYIYFELAEPKSDQNELMLFWRVRPNLKTWVDGSNPDVTRQRVRFAFGIGCGSPRRAWRGGALA